MWGQGGEGPVPSCTLPNLVMNPSLMFRSQITGYWMVYVKQYFSIWGHQQGLKTLPLSQQGRWLLAAATKRPGCCWIPYNAQGRLGEKTAPKRPAMMRLRDPGLQQASSSLGRTGRGSSLGNGDWQHVQGRGTWVSQAMALPSLPTSFRPDSTYPERGLQGIIGLTLFSVKMPQISHHVPPSSESRRLRGMKGKQNVISADTVSLSCRMWQFYPYLQSARSHGQLCCPLEVLPLTYLRAGENHSSPLSDCQEEAGLSYLTIWFTMGSINITKKTPAVFPGWCANSLNQENTFDGQFLIFEGLTGGIVCTE